MNPLSPRRYLWEPKNLQYIIQGSIGDFDLLALHDALMRQLKHRKLCPNCTMRYNAPRCSCERDE